MDCSENKSTVEVLRERVMDAFDLFTRTQKVEDYKTYARLRARLTTIERHGSELRLESEEMQGRAQDGWK